MRLIDADALMELANNHRDKMVDANDIARFPTIETEPVRHGEWVKNEKESEKHIESIYYCSICQNWEAWGETEKTKYCPNCGAKMDGKEKME